MKRDADINRRRLLAIMYISLNQPTMNANKIIECYPHKFNLKLCLVASLKNIQDRKNQR